MLFINFFFFFFYNNIGFFNWEMEQKLKEKNDKIVSLNQEITQNNLTLEKNAHEFHENIKNLKKEFESKLAVYG